MYKFKNNNSNFIEKKILEYYLGDQNSADRVFEIRHRLNKCSGFEEYIKFFYNSRGYKIKTKVGGCNPDGGIDLKGEYNGKNIYFQCKKYVQTFNDDENNSHIENKGYVGVTLLRDFFGGVASEYKGCICDNTELIYITTGRYTQDSIEFAKNNSIKLLDYKDIARISKKYSLDSFLDDYKNNGGDINQIINKYYKKEPNTNKNQLTIDNINTNDLNNYFKNIIPELNGKEGALEILDNYIKERNLKGGLKEFCKKYNINESNIINGIKILNLKVD